MSTSYAHQDWQQVVLRPKSVKPDTRVDTKTQQNVATFSATTNKPAWKIEKEVDGETGKPIKYVTKEDANAIIAGRVALKLSQKDLANRLRMKEKDIKEIEACKAIENRAVIATIKRFLQKQNESS